MRIFTNFFGKTHTLNNYNYIDAIILVKKQLSILLQNTPQFDVFLVPVIF